MTFVLNESERRELYRQLVAKPAEEIHSLLLDQLSDLSRLKVEEPSLPITLHPPTSKSLLSRARSAWMKADEQANRTEK